jgi:hypothetical protein
MPNIPKVRYLTTMPFLYVYITGTYLYYSTSSRPAPWLSLPRESYKTTESARLHLGLTLFYLIVVLSRLLFTSKCKYTLLSLLYLCPCIISRDDSLNIRRLQYYSILGAYLGWYPGIGHWRSHRWRRRDSPLLAPYPPAA